MGNVRPGSPRLWAHFCSVLLKTAVCLKALDRARRAVPVPARRLCDRQQPQRQQQQQGQQRLEGSGFSSKP